MSRPPLSLKARAIALLAQREHSRLELRRKLLAIERRARALAAAAAAAAEASHLAPPDDTADLGDDAGDAEDAEDAECTVDALLDTLSRDGYLSESRFIESRVHLRAQRFGAQRIQQELAQHGLKLDADQAADLKASEQARAREVWLRRFGPEPDRDAAAQAKQTRFLLARGFSPDVVRRLLRSPASLD
ncbi:regulatory protein RecX [Roseateles sp. BYS87W]|uniref:Regulatory protein RecX n=1 Tax=Pelomonas baiyunensis TaxID=3299026 RepID=A0ABW7GZA2_9BURK